MWADNGLRNHKLEIKGFYTFLIFFFKYDLQMYHAKNKVVVPIINSV